jgi:hypothetical protein
MIMKNKFTNRLRICLALFLLTASLLSNAQSDIVITEIMYNPAGKDTLEFIELYNKGGVPVDLNGYAFTKGITFTFSSYTLNAGAYVVVARYSEFADPFFGITTFQWTSGELDNNGEKIVLTDASGIIVDSVEYEDNDPWNPSCDGSGSSLILCDPAKNNALGYNWTACNQFKGPFLGNIVLANAGYGNASCSEPGEIFPPRVRKTTTSSLMQVNIKFDEPVSLSSAQNVVNYTGLGTITSAVRSASMDSVTLTLNNPLILGYVYTLSISNISDTSGNAMTSPKTQVVVYNNTIADLIITEIMYNNPGQDTLEYIEVYNNSGSPANVGGYKFTDGVDFMFPYMTINANEYVVMATNPNMVNPFFSISTNLQFKGALDNDGEKLTIKNTVGDLIDSVRFSDTWHWSTDPGASLVLCDLSSDNDVGTNWGASGAYAGVYEGASVYGSPGAANTSCIPLGLASSNDSKKYINIYPNPSAGTFEISCGQIKSTRRIDVLNSLGEIIYSEISDDENSKIDLSHCVNKGLYFVRVTDLTNELSYTGKIVVE